MGWISWAWNGSLMLPESRRTQGRWLRRRFHRLWWQSIAAPATTCAPSSRWSTWMSWPTKIRNEIWKSKQSKHHPEATQWTPPPTVGLWPNLHPNKPWNIIRKETQWDNKKLGPTQCSFCLLRTGSSQTWTPAGRSNFSIKHMKIDDNQEKTINIHFRRDLKWKNIC